LGMSLGPTPHVTGICIGMLPTNRRRLAPGLGSNQSQSNSAN